MGRGRRTARSHQRGTELKSAYKKRTVSESVVELTDEASVNAVAQKAVVTHGKIDVLVNNAGITGGNGTTWKLAPDVWRRVIDVNLIGPYLTCRAVVPHMLKSGYGRIVIASIAGKEGNPNASHYSASKAGLIGLTKSLGKELAGKNILVNAGDARRRQNRNLRFDVAAAHRLHALQDPDEPFPDAAGSRVANSLARIRGRTARSAQARCSTCRAAARRTNAFTPRAFGRNA